MASLEVMDRVEMHHHVVVGASAEELGKRGRRAHKERILGLALFRLSHLVAILAAVGAA